MGSLYVTCIGFILDSATFSVYLFFVWKVVPLEKFGSSSSRDFIRHLKITCKASPLRMGNKKRKKKKKKEDHFQRGIFSLTDLSTERQPGKNVFVIEIFSEEAPVISIYILKMIEGTYGLD